MVSFSPRFVFDRLGISIHRPNHYLTVPSCLSNGRQTVYRLHVTQWNRTSILTVKWRYVCIRQLRHDIEFMEIYSLFRLCLFVAVTTTGIGKIREQRWPEKNKNTIAPRHHPGFDVPVAIWIGVKHVPLTYH